jgi:hypothetical protein
MKFGRGYFDWKFVELYQVWEISGFPPSPHGVVGGSSLFLDVNVAYVGNRTKAFRDNVLSVFKIQTVQEDCREQAAG